MSQEYNEKTRMDETVKSQEFPNACPVVDPLQQIIEKLDAIESRIVNLEKQLEEIEFIFSDRVKNIEERLSSITAESLYRKFRDNWHILEKGEQKIKDNSTRLLNMINEFKGFVSMERAKFNRHHDNLDKHKE
jgi:predicted  nucleic acid-binding Zn-ribbon protein